MDEFKVIVIMNEAMIETLKEKNKDYEKNLKIQNYLKDEAFFFKIEKNTAYDILKIIGVKQEQLDTVYKKLTSQSKFYDLLYEGKINKNDDSLIVKYNVSGYDQLFKK